MDVNRFENFLSDNDCGRLIDYYQNNLKDKFRYNSTEPINILDCKDLFVSECLDKVIKKCKSLSNVYLDNAEIIRWLNGGHMEMHVDQGDKYAAITYLNDDYAGGELIIQDYKIKPKRGELIVFENSHILHGVNTVIGERFTLSSWFKSDQIIS